MDVQYKRPMQCLEAIISEGQQQLGDVTGLPTIELNLKKTICAPLMEQAVQDIVKRHPNTRSVILDNGEDNPKNKRFSLSILDPDFALRKFVFFELLELTEEWSFSVAEEQMARTPGVGSNRQQFRVVLAAPKSTIAPDGGKPMPLDTPSTAHLMVFSNHAVCDGMSGYILTNDILSRYAELCENKDSENKTYAVVPTINQLLELGESFDSSVDPAQSQAVNDLIDDLNQRNAVYKPCLPVKSNNGKGPMKNGCVCIKGTEEGVLRLKAWCKEAGITVGMTVLGAVYYTLGRYSEDVPIMNIDVDLRKYFDRMKNQNKLPCCSPNRRITVGMAVLGAVYYTLGRYSEDVPIMNIDVDLRRRFECQKNRKELPPQVALIIGMTSVHKAAKINQEEDFKTYIKKLQKELHRSLSADDHFSFNHVTEKRWMEDSPDYKDMNFSNMGLYPFQTKFENSGLEMAGYWTVGDNWCPLMFGNMVFLVNTIPNFGLCYSLTFEDFEDNRQLAEQMLERIRFLCENPEEAIF